MSEEEITIFDIILEDHSEGKIESYICQNPSKIIIIRKRQHYK